MAAKKKAKKSKSKLKKVGLKSVKPLTVMAPTHEKWIEV